MTNVENDAACKHGVPLVSRLGGPSTYCDACADAFMANPRYYADDLHLARPIPPGGLNA